MYYFYMDDILLPVAPSGLNTKIAGQNKTYILINEGQINVLKSPKLTDIDFDVMLPNQQYSFAQYTDGFKAAKYYLDAFEKMKSEKKKFQFIVDRFMPDGTPLFKHDIKVALEDYTIKESQKSGFDVVVSIKLRQYKDYGTKVCDVDEDSSQVSLTTNRETSNSPAPKAAQQYTVQRGDTLWGLAKRFYGNGSKYTIIYNQNKKVIGGNPNKIYVGQVLTIPAA